MSNAKQVLRSAKSILLVDWASPAVPRSLVQAGFTVFCASPGRYSVVELVSESPNGIDSNDIIQPKENEKGYLVFRRLTEVPSHVDIVNVFRPENEHEGIFAKHVVPLGAKVLWLQPSIGSETARRLSLEHGLEFVEGVDISNAAR
ncbi:MAG TPA: CoA-binding protein [Pyrinomonadaceae bacterium]|jgi:predicted CoA-binding protein|nr:CoA-binding protein [Pyrinomonadaceae bacterium]